MCRSAGAQQRAANSGLLLPARSAERSICGARPLDSDRPDRLLDVRAPGLGAPKRDLVSGRRQQGMRRRRRWRAGRGTPEPDRSASWSWGQRAMRPPARPGVARRRRATAVMNACRSVCGRTGLVIRGPPGDTANDPTRRVPVEPGPVPVSRAPCRSSRAPCSRSGPVRSSRASSRSMKIGPSRRSPIAKCDRPGGVGRAATSLLPPLRVSGPWRTSSKSAADAWTIRAGGQRHQGVPGVSRPGGASRAPPRGRGRRLSMSKRRTSNRSRRWLSHQVMNCRRSSSYASSCQPAVAGQKPAERQPFRIRERRVEPSAPTAESERPTDRGGAVVLGAHDPES